MRVSTFGQYTTLVQHMTRLEGTVAEAQIQQASQLKSSRFSGLDGQAATLLDLEGDLSRSATYIANGEAAVSRINATYSALQSVSDLATSFRASLTAFNTTTGNAATLQQTARGLLEDLAATLNQRSAGQYLFAGSATNTAPVSIDSASYPALSSPSSATTSYYQGDAARPSVRVSDTLTVSYGITAADPSIEAVMRALNLVANASPLDEATLTEAGGLVESASTGIATSLETLSAAASQIQDTLDRQTDLQLYAESWIEDIKGVDVAEVQTRLSTLETSLEATMQAIATFQKLNLGDYL